MLCGQSISQKHLHRSRISLVTYTSFVIKASNCVETACEAYEKKMSHVGSDHAICIALSCSRVGKFSVIHFSLSRMSLLSK